MIEINTYLGILQIVVQTFAAYFSYRIYRFSKLNKIWLTITFALILMTFRRITALLIDLDYLPKLSGWISHLDRLILPTMISILLLIGFYAMFKNFESFEIMKTEINEKIKNFKKNRKQNKRKKIKKNNRNK